MRTLIIILLTVVFSMEAYAQDGVAFPQMKGETLTNTFVNIPDDLNDKFSLICLAYSKKSEEHMKKWFSPIYNNFIFKPEKPSPFAFSYDIHVYFIPMFTGAKRPAYQKVMRKTKASVDPKISPNILFYEGTMNEYKNKLGMEKKDIPYFFVISPEGKIAYSTSGLYSDRKMQEIIDAVASSLQQH